MELDPSKVLVIGGLSDDSVKERSSLGFAVDRGVTCRRLPIREFCVRDRRESSCSFSQILTVNAVVEILLEVAAGEGWEKAFKRALPKRFGWVPREETGETVKNGEEVVPREETGEAVVNDEGGETVKNGAEVMPMVTEETGGVMIKKEESGDKNGDAMVKEEKTDVKNGEDVVKKEETDVKNGEKVMLPVKKEEAEEIGDVVVKEETEEKNGDAVNPIKKEENAEQD